MDFDFNLIPQAFDRGKQYGEAHDDLPHWRAVLVQLGIHHRTRIAVDALASFEAGRMAAVECLGAMQFSHSEQCADARQ